MQKIAILLLFIITSFTSVALSEEITETEDKYLCYIVKDPFESFNRHMFTFNTTIDGMIVRPLVGIYIGIVPEWPRARVHNFFSNLREPLTLVNNILQSDSKAASSTFGRFLVNTLFGLGGFLDFASYFELDKKAQRFDDTLAKYKLSYSNYLVLPIIGNTTTRGVVGKVGDFFLNPIAYRLRKKSLRHPLNYTAADHLDHRIQYNDVINATKKSSVDYYGKVRSMYIQYISRRNIHCPKNQSMDYSIYEEGFVKSSNTTDQKDSTEEIADTTQRKVKINEHEN
jgi:phospholipid-binding lipoprotein MlaA